MKRPVRIRYHGVHFVVDCREVDSMLPEDTATFSSIREMFGRDVYLRGFDFRRLRISNVIDAGGNRGLFSLWAASSGAETDWIECQEQYRSPAQYLWIRNGVQKRVRATVAELAPTTGNGRVSLSDVITAGRIASVSLLKIDIEGAEFELFAQGIDWLRHVQNVTMELHRAAGDPQDIVAVLRAAKFEVNVTDDHFNNVIPATATYLYASSVGALLPSVQRARVANP